MPAALFADAYAAGARAEIDPLLDGIRALA
jgi:hypothetical protein